MTVTRVPVNEIPTPVREALSAVSAPFTEVDVEHYVRKGVEMTLYTARDGVSFPCVCVPRTQ